MKTLTAQTASCFHRSINQLILSVQCCRGSSGRSSLLSNHGSVRWLVRTFYEKQLYDFCFLFHHFETKAEKYLQLKNNRAEKKFCWAHGRNQKRCVVQKWQNLSCFCCFFENQSKIFSEVRISAKRLELSTTSAERFSVCNRSGLHLTPVRLSVNHEQQRLQLINVFVCTSYKAGLFLDVVLKSSTFLIRSAAAIRNQETDLTGPATFNCQNRTLLRCSEWQEVIALTRRSIFYFVSLKSLNWFMLRLHLSSWAQLEAADNGGGRAGDVSRCVQMCPNIVSVGKLEVLRALQVFVLLTRQSKPAAGSCVMLYAAARQLQTSVNKENFYACLLLLMYEDEWWQ